LGAVKGKEGVEGTHGIDLAIGGHDHIYYVGYPHVFVRLELILRQIGKGADSWDGFSGDHDAAGTEADQGVR
jgi:5'-nucleotidase